MRRLALSLAASLFLLNVAPTSASAVPAELVGTLSKFEKIVGVGFAAYDLRNALESEVETIKLKLAAARQKVSKLPASYAHNFAQAEITVLELRLDAAQTNLAAAIIATISADVQLRIARWTYQSELTAATAAMFPKSRDEVAIEARLAFNAARAKAIGEEAPTQP